MDKYAKLLRDELEMIYSHTLPLWNGSIPQRLMSSGGMSLADLDAEIARGEALERLQERLPEVLSEPQGDKSSSAGCPAGFATSG